MLRCEGVTALPGQARLNIAATMPSGHVHRAGTCRHSPPRCSGLRLWPRDRPIRPALTRVTTHRVTGPAFRGDRRTRWIHSTAASDSAKALNLTQSVANYRLALDPRSGAHAVAVLFAT